MSEANKETERSSAPTTCSTFSAKRIGSWDEEHLCLSLKSKPMNCEFAISRLGKSRRPIQGIECMARFARRSLLSVRSTNGVPRRVECCTGPENSLWRVERLG